MPYFHGFLLLIMTITAAIIIIRGLELLRRGQINLTGDGQKSASTFQLGKLKIRTTVPGIALFIIGLVIFYLITNKIEIPQIVSPIKFTGHIQTEDSNSEVTAQIICQIFTRSYNDGKINDIVRPFTDTYTVSVSAPGYYPFTKNYLKCEIKDCIIDLGEVRLNRAVEPEQPKQINIDQIPQGITPPPIQFPGFLEKGAHP